MYAEFGVTAFWAIQRASVGQVSGNLTLCSGNSTQLFEKAFEIVG
jgi:hypothetical protein